MNLTSKSRILIAFSLCSVGALLAMVSFAADPPSGSVNSLGQTVTWTGFIPAGADVSGAGGCSFDAPANNCDHFYLTVNAPLSGASQVIKIVLNGFTAADLDLVVLNEAGQQVTSSVNPPGNPEFASFPANPGTYEITLRLPGYKALHKNLNVEKGPAIQIDETLQK